MKKDFDAWNVLKKQVDDKKVDRDFFFHEREVWWCSLGLNIGVESDGKNESFERPVIIVRKFNSEMIWVLPLTTKDRGNSTHYRKISHETGESWACLTQIKTVSTKRLIRKIGMAKESDFKDVLAGLSDYIRIGPRISAGSSEAEATNTHIISR